MLHWITGLGRRYELEVCKLEMSLEELQTELYDVASKIASLLFLPFLRQDQQGNKLVIAPYAT